MEEEPSFSALTRVVSSTPSTPFVRRTPRIAVTPSTRQNIEKLAASFLDTYSADPPALSLPSDNIVAFPLASMRKNIKTASQTRSHWFLRLQALTAITKALLADEIVPAGLRALLPTLSGALLRQLADGRSALLKEVNNILTFLARRLRVALQPLAAALVGRLAPLTTSAVPGVAIQSSNALRSFLQDVPLDRAGWEALAAQLAGAPFHTRAKHDALRRELWELATQRLAELCRDFGHDAGGRTHIPPELVQSLLGFARIVCDEGVPPVDPGFVDAIRETLSTILCACPRSTPDVSARSPVAPIPPAGARLEGRSSFPTPAPDARAVRFAPLPNEPTHAAPLPKTPIPMTNIPEDSQIGVETPPIGASQGGLSHSAAALFEEALCGEFTDGAGDGGAFTLDALRDEVQRVEAEASEASVASSAATAASDSSEESSELVVAVEYDERQVNFEEKVQLILTEARALDAASSPPARAVSVVYSPTTADAGLELLRSSSRPGPTTTATPAAVPPKQADVEETVTQSGAAPMAFEEIFVNQERRISSGAAPMLEWSMPEPAPERTVSPAHEAACVPSPLPVSAPAIASAESSPGAPDSSAVDGLSQNNAEFHKRLAEAAAEIDLLARRTKECISADSSDRAQLGSPLRRLAEQVAGAPLSPLPPAGSPERGPGPEQLQAQLGEASLECARLRQRQRQYGDAYRTLLKKLQHTRNLSNVYALRHQAAQAAADRFQKSFSAGEERYDFLKKSALEQLERAQAQLAAATARHRTAAQKAATAAAKTAALEEEVEALRVAQDEFTRSVQTETDRQAALCEQLRAVQQLLEPERSKCRAADTQLEARCTDLRTLDHEIIEATREKEGAEDALAHARKRLERARRADASARTAVDELARLREEANRTQTQVAATRKQLDALGPVEADAEAEELRRKLAAVKADNGRLMQIASKLLARVKRGG